MELPANMIKDLKSNMLWKTEADFDRIYNIYYPKLVRFANTYLLSFSDFLDDVLNGRPVDNGEHFLGNGLGRGQKTGAQTGNRDDSFADMFHRGILAHKSKPRLPDRGGT